MNKIKNVTKNLYLLIAVLIISVPLLILGITSCNGSGDNKDHSGEYNYFTSVYRNLSDGDNVFKSITFSGLNELLDTDGGTYLILFGGAWSDGTQEVIPYINEYAKKYGAENIYVFDFKLDGGIGEEMGVNADISSENHEYNAKYAEILSKLTNYAEVSGNTETLSAVIPTEREWDYAEYVTASGDRRETGTVIDLTSAEIVRIKTPTLIAYNNLFSGGPVIAALDNVYEKNELSNDEAKRNAYKADLDGFFKKTVAALRGNGTDRVTAETFNYYTGIAQLNEVHILQTVTYHELIDLFENKRNFPLLFGGGWCPNTKAIISYVDEIGQQHGVEKIYLFDLSLFGVNSAGSQPESAYHTTGETHANGGKIVKPGYYESHSNIRNGYSDDGVISANESAYGRLYVKILSYLKAFKSKWNDKAFDGDIQDFVRIDSKDYTRICCPALLIYDKDLGAVASFEAEYWWGDNAENPGTIGTGDKSSIAYRYVKTGLTYVFESYNKRYNPDFVPGGTPAEETPQGGNQETPNVVPGGSDEEEC